MVEGVLVPTPTNYAAKFLFIEQLNMRRLELDRRSIDFANVECLNCRVLPAKQKRTREKRRFVSYVIMISILGHVVFGNASDNIKSQNSDNNGDQIQTVGNDTCNIPRIDGIDHPRENDQHGEIANETLLAHKESNGGNAHREYGKDIKWGLVCKNTRYYKQNDRNGRHDPGTRNAPFTAHGVDGVTDQADKISHHGGIVHFTRGITKQKILNHQYGIAEYLKGDYTAATLRLKGYQRKEHCNKADQLRHDV